MSKYELKVLTESSRDSPLNSLDVAVSLTSPILTPSIWHAAQNERNVLVLGWEKNSITFL
jgi:hypothetical protein